MSTAVASTVDWPRWEDPSFYLQDPEVMQAQMAAQREAAPVYWYEAPALSTGMWVVSRWRDCRFIGSNPALFCNKYGFAVGDANEPTETVLAQLPEWAREEIAKPGVTLAQRRGLVSRGKLSLGDPKIENMIFLDPPRHAQVRSIFMGAMKPSLVRRLKPRMGEIADEFMDEMVEAGEEVDFVKTIGRIPAAVMTEMVGVPPSERETFIDLASAHLEAITITPDKDPEEIARVKAKAQDFRRYCDELLDERRKSGGEGDDLVSIVVRSELDGGPVPNYIAFVFVTHFLSAGETTRALLSHLAMALGQRPDQRKLLVENQDLLQNAIEETMRYYPINWTGCRTAVDDIELGGQQIAKDDFVVMAYAAANRDPDTYPDPDTYDITRSFDNDHLGFGHGEHSCPGALLARVDSLAIWERVFARFKDWELTGDPVTWSNPFLRGVASLPVRFSA
jgi:cytochrome P450